MQYYTPNFDGQLQTLYLQGKKITVVEVVVAYTVRIDFEKCETSFFVIFQISNFKFQIITGVLSVRKFDP